MIEPLPASPDGLVWGFALGITKVLDEQRDASNELVTHASDLLRNAGWKVHMFIAEGDPKSVILDEARAWNADLIVVGSHGRKGVGRFLLGSVSEAIARHAPCSVEIVRIPAP